MMPLFELENVSVVRDGTTILDRVSLRIADGEHTAILGPNGSGKSTLVKLLTHEIYPFAGVGSVRVWGQERWVVRDLRPLLGLVSPTPGEKVLGEPTCLDMAISGLLGTYGVLWGYEVSTNMRHKGMDALEFVEVAHLADRRFDTLSAGESRRVLIARALVSEPRGLLLDEPTTSLDIRARHEFVAMLSRVANAGTTLILVTHHLEEILPEIGRVVMLRKGRVCGDGTTSAMMKDSFLSELFGMPLVISGPPWHATLSTDPGPKEVDDLRGT